MADDFAIKVENVSKTFRLPHEKSSSIKSSVINFYSRKKTYELQKALENVSFEVKHGDFFAIVGRNGSGKSTLLKLLAGIYTPSNGVVHVRGKLTPFIELGVGFSPELTGRENVFLNGALLGFSRREMNEMYQDIVDFAELERFMDQKLKNYSSGMQVRLAFSIAIRAKGDILLLDEVLAVGDSAFQQKCYNYFEQLKEQKKTVVFVSHDMAAVRRFCNKAVYIKDGDLILDGETSDIADKYIADNIQHTIDAEKTNSPITSDHKLTLELGKPANGSMNIKLNYEAKDDDPMYVGISLLREGISFAEITSSLEKPVSGKGEIVYKLDTGLLNGGAYEVGAGLFRLRNRELLASPLSRKPFSIKGSDDTKGAALKLPERWTQDA
jgi:ABC-2 type transport system ATP-binding protein